MPSHVEIELFELSFSEESSRIITFSCSFSRIPQITVTTSGNENMYVSNITKSGCTVHASANITGTVRVHVIGYV